MGQIDRWQKKKIQRTGKVSLEQLSEKDVRRIVQQYMETNPGILPNALHVTSIEVDGDLTLPGDGDLDPAQTLMYTPPGYSQAVIRYLEDEHQAPVDFTDHEALTPDGNVPSAVQSCEATGGKTFLHFQWTPVTHPHKFQYDVHISASAAFTADDTNKVTTTAGDQVWIRALADGSPLQYGTTYYMQVLAWDADGYASPSPEASAALDLEASGDITVGSITAQQLEAMLVMGTTMIAGSHPPGARVEFGLTTHDDTEMIGLHAFDSENMLTFMIDANTGMVTIYGTVYFGLGSQLMQNDVIQLLEQPTGFQIPTLIQSPRNKFLGASSASCTWSFATTTGNALFMLVSVDDADGTAPVPSAPAGWTVVVSKQTGRQSVALYRVNTGTSRSGSESITIGDTASGTMILLEYSGVRVEAADETASNSGTGTAWTSGTTAATDTNVELCIAVAVNNDTTVPNFTETVLANVTDDFEWVTYMAEPLASPQFFRAQAMHVYDKVTSSTGTVDMAGDFDASWDWLGIVATFRAKVAGLEPPDTGKLQVYAEEVDGNATLHTQGEQGTPHSVVLAPQLQQWELLYITGSVNPPSTGAHSGNSMSCTATGALIGDIVVSCETTSPANRGQIFHQEPLVTVDDQVQIWFFNADTSTIDLGSTTFHFVLIRRAQ